MEDEDFLLIRAIKNGKEDAVKKVVCKYYSDMVRYCSRKIQDTNQAEDLVFHHAANMANNYFKTYILYRFRGKIIHSFQMLPLIHLLAAVIFIPLTYRSFQKYSQTN